MKKQILLGMALGALLLSVIAAVIDSRSMNSDQFNTTGNRLSIKDGVKLTNQQTGVIKDDAGVTRIIQIAGGSSGLNDGFGVNRVQIDAGGVIKLKATNAAQLFQLTADGYGEASFPWTFDNGILVGGNTNNSLWLFNPKNGLYRNFLFTDSNGDTQIDPDNDLHINSANNFINGSLDLLGPFHITNSSIFYAEIGLGISAPTHKFHIVSTSNDVVGIDSTGVDSASMLHIQNTGVQGPFFDIHSVSQRWGIGVGTNGNYELRRSPVGTDPVNGTTVLTIDSNSVATFAGNIIGNGGGLTNLLHDNAIGSVTWFGTAPATNVLIDLSLGTLFRFQATNNFTLIFTNGVDGQDFSVSVYQDSTGNRTCPALLNNNTGGTQTNRVAFGSDITGVTLTTNALFWDHIKARFNSGTAGIPNTTNKIDIIGFIRGYH